MVIQPHPPLTINLLYFTFVELSLEPILTVSSIYHPSSQNESHRYSQGQFEVLEHLQM